jgi:glycine cleavage system H protein
MNVPDGLKYTKEDEWIRIEGDEVVIGITDYAQDSLSDIVYLELPEVGDTFAAGDTFGIVESVKAAADLYMPLSGEITAINEDLVDEPEIINQDPYGAGWLIRLRMSDSSEAASLLDPEAYKASIKEREG